MGQFPLPLREGKGKMGKGGRQTAAGSRSHPQGEQMGKGKERQGSKLPSLLACASACACTCVYVYVYVCDCFLRGLVESFARYMYPYTYCTSVCVALQTRIIHFTV